MRNAILYWPGLSSFCYAKSMPLQLGNILSQCAETMCMVGVLLVILLYVYSILVIYNYVRENYKKGLLARRVMDFKVLASESKCTLWNRYLLDSENVLRCNKRFSSLDTECSSVYICRSHASNGSCIAFMIVFNEIFGESYSYIH